MCDNCFCYTKRDGIVIECRISVARVARDTSLHSAMSTICEKLDGYLQNDRETICWTGTGILQK